MAKAELPALEVQCVSGLAKEAKKLREHVPSFETAACAKILKGSKSLATGSMQKKADAKPDVDQDCGELNA